MLYFNFSYGYKMGFNLFLSWVNMNLLWFLNVKVFVIVFIYFIVIVIFRREVILWSIQWNFISLYCIFLINVVIVELKLRIY